MPDYNQIANALAGFGAGVQGQGAQFAQSMQNRKLIEQEQKDRKLLEDKERQAMMVRDAWAVNNLLDQGKFPVALKLLDNRLNRIKELGDSDPAHTQEIKDALISGDPARVAQAKQELQIFSEAGIAAGAWQPPQESLESKKFTFEQEKFKQEQELARRAQDWKEKNPNAGAASNPYFQFIPTSEGLAVGNARTGQVSMAGGANGNYMPIAADVGLKEQMAGAAERGEGEAKRVLDAKAAEKRTTQLTEGIKQAKDLIPKATGSMAGAARDAMGRAVGVSTEASKAAARLDTLAGWMVANVPRMEGPQSNIDVENYKTMAAKVGDRTVPQEERLAALDELEMLQKKYSSMNQSTISGNNQKLSGQDKQAYDWAKANPNDPRSVQILNKLGAQ